MLKEYCANAICGTKQVLENLDYAVIEKIAEHIVNSDNVFVVADLGRPGLALMSLAQRLRQLGIRAYRLEESPPTPSVHEGDIVLVASVDGEDKTPITFMKKAVSLHIDYDLLTMVKGSTLEKDATETLIFDCADAEGLIAEEYFELALFVVCEAIVMYVQNKISRSRERMQLELPNIF